jgi:uncharacterized heparinase superfamily protein
MAPVWRTQLYARLFLPIHRDAALSGLPPATWPGDAANGARILAGSIRLIGREQVFSLSGTAPLDWNAGSEPLLWRFTLHYFEWLADLAALGEADHARAIVADWINRHPRPEGLAWHPYPLSLRLWSWLAQGEFLLDGADETFRAAFTQSLDRQARHLRRTVERPLGGNHLIKNLKALIAAGQCITGHDVAGTAALTQLRAATRRQILADGGHEERSPQYHFQVLCDLVDIKDLLTARGSVPNWLADAIARMASALAFFRLGDGSLGLFNDGTIGEPRLLAAIEARLGGLGAPPAALPDCGYSRLTAGAACVLLDNGLCCPDDLPAHAHADALSFEFSTGGQRLIVNSGTYAYQDPAWRNQLRGTAAHSTLDIDGLDSAEVHGVFRLGRRPRRVSAQPTQDNTGNTVEARHDGYRHLGLTHIRRLTLSLDGRSLSGEDRVERSGRPGMPRQVTAHFHLHPAVAATARADGAIDLVLPGGEIWLFEAPGETLVIEASQYAPQFYEMQTTTQIAAHKTLSTDVAIFAWRFRRLS